VTVALGVIGAGVITGGTTVDAAVAVGAALEGIASDAAIDTGTADDAAIGEGAIKLIDGLGEELTDGSGLVSSCSGVITSLQFPYGGP
jgi:hypothetical protein